MHIAVDFDGTMVTHEYPAIGRDIGAFPILKELVGKGHQIILFTMRSGDKLDEALNYIEGKRLLLYGINHNPDQDDWNTSPKAYAHMYIDDASLGTPLIVNGNERAYVDWKIIKEMLHDKFIL